MNRLLAVGLLVTSVLVGYFSRPPIVQAQPPSFGFPYHVGDSRSAQRNFSEFESPDQRYWIRGEEDFVPILRDQWASRRLEDIVEGILYTGPDKTSSGIWPQLCADPGYIKMRVDRIALIGLPPPQADAVKRVCNLK